MRKYRKHQEYLLESLKDPEEASAYLKASLDEAIDSGDFGVFQVALRNVVEAKGGISEVSSKMDVGRESFYKSLSQKGKPRFSTIIHALKSCGVELDFHPVHI